MEKKVIIGQYQQATSPDFTRAGEYTQESLDRIAREGVTADLKFTGFATVADGPTSVLVGTGSFWSNGRIFRREEESAVSLQTLLPAVTRRIIALVTWGTEQDTDIEPRTFLKNATTREAEARSVATTRVRLANIGTVSGTESTEPARPQVNADTLPFAYVTLTPAGIESITLASENVLPSVAKNAADIVLLQTFQQTTGARLATIDTQITGLADRIRNTTPLVFSVGVARDVAELKTKAGLPDNYSAYGFDPFLVLDQSDSDHNAVTGAATNPAFLCKIMEGIRFADAQAREAQLSILNNDDTRVSITENRMLPAFSEVERIVSVGNDDEISISQYSVQTVEMVQRTETRQRVRYGGYFMVCTNSAFWVYGQYDPVSGILRRGNETFEVDYGPFGYTDPANNAHRAIRIRQFWVDDIEEPYWDQITETFSATGSIVAQTFLNSQETWATSIGLFFTRKGNADMTLAICEADDGGKPRYDRVITRTAVPLASIKVWPEETKIPLQPTLLKRGQRYAIVPISTGNHFLALTQNNKFAQGSLFSSTDGAWFQGDLIRDLAFKIYSAKFVAPRVEIQMQPLELANGIAAIDILADAVLPGGTTIQHEVKVDNVWTAFGGGTGADPLAGLPALLQYRIVLVGTVDLMPQIGVGPRGTVTTTRPRTDLVHISDVQTMPAPINSIILETRLEGGYDDAYHTSVVRILSGAGYATSTNAAVITDRPADDDPAATIRKYAFTFGAPISSFKIRTEGTTDSALRCYHVAFRNHVALAT